MPRNLVVASHRSRIELRARLVRAIEEERAARGWAVSTLCNSIGLQSRQWKRIATGEGRAVSIDSLIIYLDRLGIDVEITTSERKADVQNDNQVA